MFWLMVCHHKDGMDERRAAVRDAHRAHVAAGGNGDVKVTIGSALTADFDEIAIGNFGIIEAKNREDVQTFAQSDPYYLAGVVERVNITALASRFPAHRIAKA